MSENETEEKSILCCLCTAGCAILAGIGSFMAFGIIFLVQNWDEYSSCNGSEMAPYVIVALVLTWGNLNATKSSKKESSFCENVLSLLLYFLLNTGLAIWGGIELWVKSCDDLKDTNLWKFSLAVFIIQVTSATILLLVPFVLVCVLVNDKEVPSNKFHSIASKNDDKLSIV